MPQLFYRQGNAPNAHFPGNLVDTRADILPGVKYLFLGRSPRSLVYYTDVWNTTSRKPALLLFLRTEVDYASLTGHR
jgi:hypothetical protein